MAAVQAGRLRATAPEGRVGCGGRTGRQALGQPRRKQAERLVR